MAVREGKRMDGREGLESCEREGKVRGAVGKVEGNEVAKGLRAVTNGGVVRGRLDARVSCGGNVEGFKCFNLFRV